MSLEISTLNSNWHLLKEPKGEAGSTNDLLCEVHGPVSLAHMFASGPLVLSAAIDVLIEYDTNNQMQANDQEIDVRVFHKMMVHLAKAVQEVIDNGPDIENIRERLPRLTGAAR